MDQKLRKLQLCILQVLYKYVEICEKNHLRYFPEDGTLLGLVRHGAFIPWDDDVDMVMPRYDFERLPAILDKELPNGMYYSYFKKADKNDKNILYGIRIFSSAAKVKTCFYNEEMIEDVNIDIFPLDGMPEGKLKNKIHQLRLLTIKAILKLSQIKNVRTFVKRPLFDTIVIRVGQVIRLDRMLNTKKWYDRLDRTLKKYDYESSNLVCQFWSDYRFKEMVPKSYYEPSILKKFEEINLPCPAKAELILEQIYGDWRKPPKEGKKQKHPIELTENYFK